MNRINATLSNQKSVCIKGVILGVIFGSLSVIALLGITAVVFLKSGKLPAEIIEYILLALDAIGGFIGGYIATRTTKSGGMIWGAITGLCLFIIVLVAGLATSPETVTLSTLYKAIVLVITGIIGGIKGVNRKDKIRIK